MSHAAFDKKFTFVLNNPTRKKKTWLWGSQKIKWQNGGMQIKFSGMNL